MWQKDVAVNEVLFSNNHKDLCFVLLVLVTGTYAKRILCTEDSVGVSFMLGVMCLVLKRMK